MDGLDVLCRPGTRPQEDVSLADCFKFTDELTPRSIPSSGGLWWSQGSEVALGLEVHSLV